MKSYIPNPMSVRYQVSGVKCQVSGVRCQVIRTTHYILQPRRPILWIGLAALSGLFYLAVSAWRFGVIGFPLDDAWIHQTYARNLAYTGQLAFTPGVPSAGSTAPLWTFLLSLGYLLGFPFQLWTYTLGILFLGLTGWTVSRLAGRLFPDSRRLGLWAGLFCLFEWHLIWAAVSGMETLLFIWLSLFLVERYLAYQLLDPSSQDSPLPPRTLAPLRFYLYLGFLGGLLTLTRPEGLGLVGLIGLDIAYRYLKSPTYRTGLQFLISKWLALALGLSLPLLPYIAFHLWATGLPFPNTFYAKQAEYGIILQSFPLWQRLFGNFGPPIETVQGVFRVIFIGPQLLLLPGLFFGVWLTLKERRFELMLIWVWWISYLTLYAVRLPVTYQHGRYQIPVIAWVILLGLWGVNRLFTFHNHYQTKNEENIAISFRPAKRGEIPTESAEISGPKRFEVTRFGASSKQRLLRRVAGRVMFISLLLLIVSFMVIGAQAYGRDARIIDSEMVATAKWLAENTESEALIAAHDIGAIGYFTQRPIIDLAGLVTPEVIPIIRDEAALFDFMVRRRADYLATFPSWYPDLVENSALLSLHSTAAPWAPQAGGENMVVYRVRLPNQP